MVRNLGKIVLKELPGVYNKGVKKIKDKKLKKKLDSEIGHSLVNKGSEYARSKLGGVFWTYIQKRKLFFLIALGLQDLKDS